MAQEVENGLVQIGRRGGVSRRSFLKIAGATSAAVGLSACADSKPQNVLPYVKGEADQIPGVAVWYNSTCTECSAGCGIQVRTREGRAVKIEGNPNHPVNRGGVCAIGHSALQAHYDPDRVRQPLIRDTTGAGFKVGSWDDGLAKIAEALTKDEGKKRYLVTGEMTGAARELTEEWCDALKFEHVVYEVNQPVAVAEASRLVFGTYGIPQYSIDKADLILNFGADFLETWVSPCEFARDWASTRRTGTPARVIHVEPRLSLSGANSDLWLRVNPGTEPLLAKAILKLLVERNRGDNLSGDVRGRIEKVLADTSVDAVSAATGVSVERIALVAQRLAEAESSLVIGGGSSATSQNGLATLVAVNLINLVLKNVGKTVDITKMRVPETSAAKMREFVEALKGDQVGVVLIDGSNPVFNLPGSFGLDTALRRSIFFGSLSAHLDETAALADYVLPASSSLESWGDVRTPGAASLVQPSMRPLFDTISYGDILIQLAAKAQVEKFGGGAKDFFGYLQASWKKLQAGSGEGDFEKFWNQAVERGGWFESVPSTSIPRVDVSADISSLVFEATKFEDEKGDGSDLVLIPYPSVRSFDGRSANRPWLQELPDPITSVVWDTWIEIHPDTAKAKGITKGDNITVRNALGEVHGPAYITDHVAPGVVAVPIGQGHAEYGRYAKKVQTGNVFSLLPSVSVAGADGQIALCSTRVSVQRGVGASKMVKGQWSHDQGKRELARMRFLSAGALGAGAAHDAHGESHGHRGGHNGHGEGHHQVKQMYVQREPALYRWGMAIDLAACTGCSACVVACSSENNVPAVGPVIFDQGREMSWLRIERYSEGPAEELKVSFMPMMCQHCNNAPCEPVCPVYATYHNEEGLNQMVYNRCVGTRYCSNNCSYKVRRFNWFEYEFPSPLDLQLNPDVVKRGVGVMEKCTFCVQRIHHARDTAKDEGRLIQDGEVQPACVQSCPTQALVFGNLNDPNSRVNQWNKNERAYKVLDHHINTQPSVSYLDGVKYRV